MISKQTARYLCIDIFEVMRGKKQGLDAGTDASGRRKVWMSKQ